MSPETRGVRGGRPVPTCLREMTHHALIIVFYNAMESSRGIMNITWTVNRVSKDFIEHYDYLYYLQFDALLTIPYITYNTILTLRYLHYLRYGTCTTYKYYFTIIIIPHPGISSGSCGPLGSWRLYLFWPKRGRVAEQGMVFRVFHLYKWPGYTLLSILNKVSVWRCFAGNNSVCIFGDL